MKVVAGVIAVAVCSAVFGAGLVKSTPSLVRPRVQRTLSFDLRVDAQAAIERVYYAHQIGATKPFDEAVPRAMLEAKVRKYLEQTVALQTYWKSAVTDETLQRELERMAQGTRMPERLQEVYAALGNDTFLIKECVARATLVDRLTRNFFAFDARYQAAARTAIDTLRAQLASGAVSPNADHPNRTVSERPVGPETEVAPGPSIDSSAPTVKLEDKSLKRAVAGQPSPIVEFRDGFAFDVVLSESPTSARVATYVVPKVTWSVWWSSAHAALRAESVVAVASDRVRLPQPTKGSTFDPNAACTGDGWNDGVLDDLPEPRAQHSAVWTGSLMLVWGGTKAGFALLETGGRYDPVTDTWQPMTTVNAPRPRIGNSTVWTGSEMIIWGGFEFPSSNLWFVSGGRYDPIADRWTRMSLGPSARRFHTAVWTGTRMIVWGGYFSLGSQYAPDILNTGALYDPSTDSWTPTATSGAPPGRYEHSAIWTGSEMIVWGGYAAYFLGGTLDGNGGRYNPSTNSWSPMTGTTPRANHSAIWTGSLMVVWGGSSFVPCPNCDPNPLSVLPVNTGSRYDPVQDRWTVMSTVGAPDPMNSPLSTGSPPPVTWTGHDMIVLRSDGRPNAGWRYDPSTNHWTGIASDGSSPAPIGASLIWTGKLAISWGGFVVPSDFRFGVYLNTGRRYDPWTDSWTPTSTSSPASQRSGHSAVWTGNEMVVWGGATSPSFAYLSSGGRYDPATDSWTATATESAPTPRSSHSAFWSGDRMLVWGGVGSADASHSGGRYDPWTDTWSSISAADAPSPRIEHAAAWTGRRMVVWGGLGEFYQPLQSGAVYDPATDHWTTMSTVNAPPARHAHTAVWTGSRVVVWGGLSADYPDEVFTDTGGQYDPETDTWTPTSDIGAPSPRRYHSAVWAGDRMVVWGGESSYSSVATGGRYDPAHDVWSPTTTVGAPPPTVLHSAVAAGNSMLIWGGFSYGFNTGGIYDVANDRWTKITKPGVAPALVTLVWTGDAMITWSGISGGRYYPGHSRDDDCDQDGVTAAEGDCDDHDPATYPGASERCDGVANDCRSFGWPSSGESDADRDGWLNCGGDCNDNNIYQHPGAVEACDGWDTDCDGQDPTLTEADNDNDGYRICQGDCDDTRWGVNPGRREECDGYDDDCDGAIDEGGDALCVFNDGCVAGKCDGSEGCIEVEDVVGACDDKRVCTVDDQCIRGECTGTPKANGTPCDDGAFCTVNEVCYYGQCYEGQSRDCGRDNNDCNGREYCDFNTDKCATLDVLNCDDGNICTIDACDPVTGCFSTNNSDPCDDGNACTVGDTCGDGLCLPGVAPNCDDGNPCTVDSCDPQSGCVHVPEPVYTPCDDGNACDGVDYCDGFGTCVSPSPIQCPDSNACTEDFCDPAIGCVNRPYPAGTSCSDGNACNGVELCDGAGACASGHPAVCRALDQCHTIGICDPASGACSNPIVANGTACNDASLCTIGETCQSGTCTPAFSGLNAPNPRSNGYYMRLCLGPHSGDQLTDADAVCVRQVATTFAGIATFADLCAVLRPQHPNDDPCDRTSADLMVLALNICRARVCTAQSIDSQCGGNANVGQSLVESDAILMSPSRNSDTCAHAKCLDEEINTGRALELNSLGLRREGSAIRLDWSPPYLDDGTGHPSKYHVWRRVQGSLAPFAKIGTTTDPTYLDTLSGSGAFEYEVTAVMN